MCCLRDLATRMPFTFVESSVFSRDIKFSACSVFAPDDMIRVMQRTGEHRTPHIVIDARMITFSGIGRYLRHLLDAIQVVRDIRISLLGSRESILTYYPNNRFTIIEMHSNVYSPLSQIQIPFLVPDCDIYYSPHFTTTSFPVRARKRILTIHDLYHISDLSLLSLPAKSYTRLLISGSIKASDLICVDSAFTRSEIVRLFPDSQGKLRTVYCTVNTDVFYPGSSDAGFPIEPYVLFVGNLKPHKNLMTAAAVIAEIPDRSVHLKVVGERKGFIHGMGVQLTSLLESPRLVYVGSIPDHELRHLYANALCLLFPSTYEGFGLPALEAMSCGCPVVCSSLPSLREICGEAALYCSTYSVSDYSSAISMLSSDAELRRMLVQKGLQQARLFSMESFRKNIHSVFNL
jgi:glycosyltransferase involved in cell wall biosynthesis